MTSLILQAVLETTGTTAAKKKEKKEQNGKGSLKRQKHQPVVHLFTLNMIVEKRAVY